jgi:hypothetical protein
MSPNAGSTHADGVEPGTAVGHTTT